MKQTKQNNRVKVEFLGYMILLAAIVGCCLITKYRQTDKISTPTKPYQPPLNAFIPDLYTVSNNSSETYPETTDTQVNPTEKEDSNDQDTLPRNKYNLPYPQKERPQQINEIIVQQTSRSGYEYFDDSVFLGDSVTLGLKNYTTQKRKTDSYFLGTAKFIAVGSYGIADTLEPVESKNSIHALYNGTVMQPQDIIKAMGVNRVFICLGLNDIGIYTKNEYLNNYLVLINRIRKEVPEIQIVILSVTPLTAEGERKILYNAKIDEYNNELALFANDNNCYFIDIASVLKNSEGYLADNLSSDNYCHLMPEAYELWIDYMLTHRVPTAEEESAMANTDGEAIHIEKGIPEIEGWEGYLSKT